MGSLCTMGLDIRATGHVGHYRPQKMMHKDIPKNVA
jgi:hypothetical protein